MNITAFAFLSACDLSNLVGIDYFVKMIHEKEWLIF